MSVQTEAGQYGQVYGTSAVSAFGGPAHPQSPYSAVFARRERADSSLTVHAMPGNDFSPFGRQSQAKQKAGRSTRTSGPDPSTLATSEPNLTLHAKMYAAGHRYGIGGLKTLALDKFKIQLTRHWYGFGAIPPSFPLVTDHEYNTGVLPSLQRPSMLYTTPRHPLTRSFVRRSQTRSVGITGCWTKLRSKWRFWRSTGWLMSC